MKKKAIRMGIGLLIILLGVVIISLPDQNERIISFSNNHGPSLFDFFGIVILFVGYLYIVYQILKNDQTSVKNISRTQQFFIGLGSGLTIASVVGDFRHWWIIGVFILGLVQLIIMWKYIRKG